MKLIIAGSRHLTVTPEFITQKLVEFEIYNKIEEVVSGTASGIDVSGELWVDHHFLAELEYQHRVDCTHVIRIINLTKMPADWKIHGKKAGPIRNKQMAEYADALLLIWDGKSKGSANMKKMMISLNKLIYEVII